MILRVDLTEVPPSVRTQMHRILTREHDMANLQAMLEQRRLAQFHHARKLRAIDGIGPKTMAISPRIQTWARMKYGNDVADGDPEFWPWLNKSILEGMGTVFSGGTRNQVGWTPPQQRQVKFKKSYA